MALKWDTYRVEIEMRRRLVGGIPIVPEGERVDAYESWARGQGVEPDAAADLAERLAADPDMPVATAELAGPVSGFRRDAETGELYVEARQVKACLREAAQRLGLIQRTRGLRQVFQHDLYVEALDGSEKLRLGTTEAQTFERPIAVVTRQGPRQALVRREYVEGARLRFRLRVLAGGVADGLLDEGRIAELLEFAGWLGLGADRSQGEGQFYVTAYAPEEEVS